jgi:hypothetical protein
VVIVALVWGRRQGRGPENRQFSPDETGEVGDWWSRLMKTGAGVGRRRASGEICLKLSNGWTGEFGHGLFRPNPTHMIRFAQVFPDRPVVIGLARRRREGLEQPNLPSR